MQLHEIKPKNYNKSKIRVGRGGKRGTTSGRGQKGQKSRAGRKLRPAIRDLIARLPKRRGFKNKPMSPGTIAIPLGNLAEFSSEVTAKLLKEKGLLPKKFRGSVKIIGSHKLTKSLSFKGIKVSKTARKNIEEAGGTIK